MNPFSSGAIGELIRIAIVYALGRLGSEAAGISNEDVAKATDSVVLGGVAIWSLWQKWRESKKLVTAAAMPESSLDEVDEMVKTGAAPPVSTPSSEVPKLVREQ